MTHKEDKAFTAILWLGVAFVLINIALTMEGVSPYQLILG